MPFDDGGNWYYDPAEGLWQAPPVVIPGGGGYETPVGSGGSGYSAPVPVAPPPVNNVQARKQFYAWLQQTSQIVADWFMSVTTDYSSVAGLNQAYQDGVNRLKAEGKTMSPIAVADAPPSSGTSDEVSQLKQRLAELEQAIRTAGVAVSRDSQHKLIIGSGVGSEFQGLEGEYARWAQNPPFVLSAYVPGNMVDSAVGRNPVPKDLWTALKTPIPGTGWPTFGKVSYAEAFLQDTGHKPMEIVGIVKSLLGIGVALAVHESTKSFQMGHLAKGAVDAILAGGKATFNGTWAPYATDNGNPLLPSAIEVPDGLPNEIFEDYRYVCFDFVTGNFWPSDEIKATVDDGRPHRWSCFDRMDGRMYVSDVIKKPRIALEPGGR